MEACRYQINRSKCLFIFYVLVSIYGCGVNAELSEFQQLSNETLSVINAPLYSTEQIRTAQYILQERIWEEVKNNQLQNELKGFACLVVSQMLDQTSSRGERASDSISCGARGQRCPHLCKRSRIPKTITLPEVYFKAAHQHDELLWSDLKVHEQWEDYLRRCLTCERASEVKAKVCLRGVDEIDLLGEYKEPLFQKWWDRCDSVTHPEVKALRAYRKWMITPATDLPLNVHIESLDEIRQETLRQHAIFGEAKRLAYGPLDGEKIDAFLNKYPLLDRSNALWTETWSLLESRLDAQLMPCLEWGLDTCSTAGQEEPARLQALNYLGRCKRCDYASEVEDWLGSQGLKFIPRWSISHSSTPQSILNQDFYVFSGVRLSKFKLNTALLNTSSSSTQNIYEPNTSIHQWSHFFEMNGSWETNTATQDPVHLLTPTQMSWGSPSLSSPAHTLWLRSQYQLTSIDTHTSKTNWIFTYPTDSKGVLLGCDQLSPLTDHVLCVGSKEAIVLNESGELLLKLPCVNKQCGELLFSSNKHLALYDLDRKSLHIYQLYGSKSVDPNFIGEGEVRPAYQSISLPSGLIDAQIDQEILFVTTPNFVQAINLVSGTVIWTLPLHLTARLLITPSVIFALSKNSLNALSLQTGKRLWTSTFKFRSSARKRRSFDTSPDRLPSRLIKRLGLVFVADHLRQSVSAYQEETGQLQWKKSTPLSWPLELDHLDRQLIIISPQKGDIIGVHHLSGEPQWRFKRPTFLKAKFTRQWASITEKDRLSLYSIQTIRSQMTSSKPKPSKSKPKPSKSKPKPSKSKMSGDDKALLTLTQELPMTSQDLEERCINTNQSACVLLGEQLAQNGEDFSMFEGLWEQGCIWGESRGCLSLGELAMKGTNSEELGQVPQMKRAFSLFKRALALNSPEAALHLGYLYQDGKGVLIDYYKAQRSFRIACDQGLAEACGRLAHLYELGLGSKSKPIAALRLYRDACTQKDQWSCEQKKRLNK